MKPRLHALLLGLCLVIAQVAFGLADPLGDGLVAYAIGDYGTALRCSAHGPSKEILTH